MEASKARQEFFKVSDGAVFQPCYHSAFEQKKTLKHLGLLYKSMGRCNADPLDGKIFLLARVMRKGSGL